MLGSCRPLFGICRAKVVDQRADAIHPQLHVEPVRLHFDAFDEQLEDAGLFGREQFVPDGIEIQQGLPYFGPGDPDIFRSCRAPGCDDDFRGAEQAAKLTDNGCLDLGGLHAAHHAGRNIALQQPSRSVIAVKPS